MQVLRDAAVTTAFNIVYCSISKCFFKLELFPLIEGNSNMTKKKYLLNKHSLFLYLFLVHMNTEVQASLRILVLIQIQNFLVSV